MFTKKVIVTPKGDFSPENATIYKNQIVFDFCDEFHNETYVFDISECYEKDVPIFVRSTDKTFEEYEKWEIECDKWYIECSQKASEMTKHASLLDAFWKYIDNILPKIENGMCNETRARNFLTSIMDKYRTSKVNENELEVYGLSTQTLIDYLSQIEDEEKIYRNTLTKLLKRKPHYVKTPLKLIVTHF